MRLRSKIAQEVKFKLLSLVLFLFIGTYMQAQLFSQLYFEQRPAMLFSSIEECNGKYYVIGSTLTKNNTGPPYYGKALFGKIKADGSIDSIYGLIDSNTYSYGLFLNTLKRTADGNFIASGDVDDTQSKAFIVKTDTSGNILLWHEYAYPNATIFHGQDVIETPDSGYLLAVNISINHTNKILIIRTDVNGDIIVQKFFDRINFEFPTTIKPLMNGHYMIAANNLTININPPNTAQTWLIEIDSMCNKIREWIDTDDKTGAVHGMLQTEDSGWILTRNYIWYDEGIASQVFKSSILRLDNKFNKVWEKRIEDSTYYDCILYDIEELPDGNFIACGVKPKWGQDSAYLWGWILKLQPNGDIIWDKEYLAAERFGARSYLKDIDVLPNGDLLACGEMEYSYDVGIRPSDQGWILRTDSNGCVLDNCTVGIEEVDKPELIQITISPNPFTTDLAIALQKEGLHEATFTITNTLGQAVYTRRETNLSSSYTKMLDLSYLPGGIYFVEVVIDGERVVRQVVKE